MHPILVTQFSYNALRHSYLVIASVRCQVHVWTPHSFIHSFDITLTDHGRFGVGGGGEGAGEVDGCSDGALMCVPGRGRVGVL